VEKLKMKNVSKIFLIITALFLFSNGIAYSDIKAKAVIDTNRVLIGEHISITLSVKSDEFKPVVWPQLKDSAGRLEIISESLLDTIKTKESIELKKTVKITSFDEGEYDLSPITFLIQKEGVDEVAPIVADIPVLEFLTVILDSTSTLKDIKAPIEEPLTFKDFLPWILVILGILVAIFTGLYLYRRYKKNQAEKPVLKFDPKIPPHILALQQLKALEEKKLWQNSKFKEYFVDLTQIIRLYIERQFDVMALEMTSGELKKALEILPVSQTTKDNFAEMLENADLVKFAKFNPIPDVCLSAIKVCYKMIEETKPTSTAEE
jgi:hypothetical protein